MDEAPLISFSLLPRFRIISNEPACKADCMCPMSPANHQISSGSHLVLTGLELSHSRTVFYVSTIEDYVNTVNSRIAATILLICFALFSWPTDRMP